MSDHDDLIQRLEGLGHPPVDPATASRHLAQMATVPPSRPGLGRKLRVAGAVAVALVFGTTGLAYAGALPEAAEQALAKVGIRVGNGNGKGVERYTGPECGLDADGQPIKWRNHGQYVKSQPEDARDEAAESRCGKPLKASTDDDGDTDVEGRPARPDCAAQGKANAAAAPGRNRSEGEAAEGKALAKGKASGTPEPGNGTAPACAKTEGSPPAPAGASNRSSGKAATPGERSGETGDRPVEDPPPVDVPKPPAAERRAAPSPAVDTDDGTPGRQGRPGEAGTENEEAPGS